MSGGRETMFETMFFSVSSYLCLDPWTVLRQADLRRNLFWGRKGMFLCFYVKKIVPVDTLFRLVLTAYENFFRVFLCSLYVGFVPVSNLLDIHCSIWGGVFLSKFLFVTDPKPKFGWRVFGGPRSVTAEIGFSVDLDLHEKLLLRNGSMWC